MTYICCGNRVSNRPTFRPEGWASKVRRRLWRTIRRKHHERNSLRYRLCPSAIHTIQGSVVVHRLDVPAVRSEHIHTVMGGRPRTCGDVLVLP